MRRVVLILAVMLLGVMMFSGVALARDITGTNGPDTLIGTINPDEIFGLRGADYIAGRPSGDELYGNRANDEVHGDRGNDFIDGGFGSDWLFGGPGDDTISAADGYEDRIRCGTGFDTVYADNVDNLLFIDPDCEDVIFSE